MLTIEVKSREMFNETTNEFSYFEGGVLQMEHSLIAVRKWEAKWHVPFLDDTNKPFVQIKDYFRYMTINKPKDSKIYDFLTQQNVEEILAYIKDSHTATWFSKEQMKGSPFGRREKITAELVYYWMIGLNIPIEFERWHLNQLMTLINLVSIKNKESTKKGRRKKDPKEAAAEIERLNEARKAKWNTRG